MAHAAPGTVCAMHPAAAAVAVCDFCSKPLCAVCRHEDVSADAVFCSQACLAAHHRTSSGVSAGTSNAQLVEGYKRPIVNGWKLWLRSLPALALYIAPVALLAGAAYGRIPQPVEGQTRQTFSMAEVGFLIVLIFGVALVQVVLSQQYTGLVRGNAAQWTLRRFIFWVGTGILTGVATLLGFIALIVPGIILGLRLFWADEFALVHQYGPIRSLKESWWLTKGQAGQVFIFQLIAGLAAYVPLILLVLVFLALSFALSWLRGGVAVAGIAEGTLLSFMLLSFYSVVHAPEIVYFYGMRATQATPLAVEGKVLGV